MSNLLVCRCAYFSCSMFSQISNPTLTRRHIFSSELAHFFFPSFLIIFFNRRTYFRSSGKRAWKIKNRIRLRLALGSYENALWGVHLLSSAASSRLRENWRSLVRMPLASLFAVNEIFTQNEITQANVHQRSCIVYCTFNVKRYRSFASLHCY